MKNIVHFTGMHSYKFGSLENYFLYLAKKCHQAGYQTFLQYESMPSSQDYLSELLKNGTEVIIFPTHCNPAKMSANCFRLLKAIKADIVHTHFVNRYAKIVIPILSRVFSSRRVVCTVHNKPPYQKEDISRLAYNLYNSVLPVSKSVESSLLIGGVNPAVMRTHYLGLFGEKLRSEEYRKSFRKKLDIPLDAIVLTCIAFDAPFKGIDILLEAFQIIYEKYTNVYLLSIGIDTNESSLPSIAHQLGISNRVRWAGVVDQGWQTLSSADIYIQPSRAEEGLPLAIMEAMAMKMPIVCTNISGNIEAVIDGQNGLVCEPDENHLAEAIEKMLLQPLSWEEMGKAGYKRFCELFDGEKSVTELIMKYYT